MIQRLTFKEFLTEGTVKDSPNRKRELNIDTATLHKALSGKCSVSYKYLIEHRKAIYRGMSIGPKIMLVEYGLGVRRAENTADYYRMLIDENPKFANFPKRSRSMIASTEIDYAFGSYGNGGQYFVFPFDTTPIGVVSKFDIFNVNFDFFNQRINVDTLSTLFARMIRYYSDENNLGIKQGAASLDEFIKYLDGMGMNFIVKHLKEYKCIPDTMPVDKFSSKYGITNGKEFVEYIFQNVLTPEKLDLHVHDPKEFYVSEYLDNNHEVWISDKCILVEATLINDLIAFAKKQS